MQMTEEGLELIRAAEEFRAQAYRCPAGHWTIGYGHTSEAGPPAVTEGMTMSEAEALALLAADVARFSAGVAAALTRPVSETQFSALVSFAYNVGLPAFASSSVLAAVNAGDFDAVPRRLQLWVKGGGRVLPGLVKRRAAEAALFVSGSGPDGAAAPDDPAAAPEPTRGKLFLQSSTIRAALLAALSALAAAGASPLRQMALTGAGLACACCLWVVRERIRKSREEGV